MARTESRTKTGIWGNDAFRRLPVRSQRLYWMLYSQPNISLCGVIAYTPGRWVRYAVDDSLDQIEADLEPLVRLRFVVVDYETAELFIRSFMRNDGVWRSPKTRASAVSQADVVLSSKLRRAIGKEMERLSDAVSDGVSDG